jgi:hypothetical protein
MSRSPYTFPMGRTVPAEEAIQPASTTLRCGECDVLYQPRSGGVTCLTCERGGDGALGKLIQPRAKPVPPPADVAVFTSRKERAR